MRGLGRIRGIALRQHRRLHQRRCRQRVIHSLKVTQSHDPRIIFVGVPLHGNLGDHAIAVAMRSFFRQHFPDMPVVEIPGDIFSENAGSFGRWIQMQDRIAVIGGGFLGSLWLNEEEMVRSVVRQFPKNRIVIFPQTVFFEDSEQGCRELEITRKLYQAHPDLHLAIRDDSIGFVQKKLCGGGFSDVFSAPDMVLHLNRSRSTGERKGVLLCFRSDKEKVVSEDAVERIQRRVSEAGDVSCRTDTVVPYSFSARDWDAEVEEKLDEFRKTRLVITDRLHGMIFAAICGTPCIALNNSSGKIKGVWSRWMQHLPYVRFVESVEEAGSLIDEMLTLGGHPYSSDPLCGYWDALVTAMR